MEFKSLSDKEEHIGKEIVDAAYKVHQAFGPGILESIYRHMLLL